MQPVTVAIFVLIGAYVLRDLGLGVTASRFAESGTIVTIVLVWLLLSTVNLFRDLYGHYLEIRGRESGLMLLRPVSNTAKAVIAVFATVIWLDNAGVNVTALITGLGVGGLAVALVLQKPMEDILGAITLYTQQPVMVGQFCTSGDITGTIEAINLRSTRVRKINNSVVIIPNSLFATASIENISERNRILHRQVVRLALDTSASDITAVLERLRGVVEAHPKTIAGQWRVRFIELGEFSKNIEVFAHIESTDWQDFLAISEDINLKTIDVLDDVGVRLAVPPR